VGGINSASQKSCNEIKPDARVHNPYEAKLAHINYRITSRMRRWYDAIRVSNMKETASTWSLTTYDDVSILPVVCMTYVPLMWCICQEVFGLAAE
jgi:hypothetical protein